MRWWRQQTSGSSTPDSGDAWTSAAVPAIPRQKVQTLFSSWMKRKQLRSSHSSENPRGSLSSGDGRRRKRLLLR
ncbi:hypothetical protein AAC387_Pa06g2264 [Persea americana]